MNGVICLNKPQDFTSFDAVAKLRGILHIRKIGHGGTLDPMATGVLPIFVGSAAKACDIIPDSSKSYRAGFRLGISTDTQDITGNVTHEFNKTVSENDLLETLPMFTGNIMQIPPMYSAVKINGRRLYDLARKGVEIERPARPVCIDKILLENFDAYSQSGTLSISCSKGTYIRTIINDIGEHLGCGGTMTSLVRTSAAGFTLDDCVTFEEIQKAADSGSIENLLHPTDTLFTVYPALHLNEHQTRLYRNGVRLDLKRVRNILPDTDSYRVYGCDGKFIGIAAADRNNNVLKSAKNFT